MNPARTQPPLSEPPTFSRGFPASRAVRARSAPCAVVLLALAALAAGAGGCARQQTVTRVDPTTQVDYDYRFNDTDARLVWQRMVGDALFRGWLDRWILEHRGERPVFIVGDLQNNTHDVINMKLFTRNFEREMQNSGRVRVVTMRDQRGQLRDERIQGHEWNSPETRKQIRNELGADLMLIGDVNDHRQETLDRRSLAIYYQVNLSLADIETNEQVWTGTVEIKKLVRRGG